MGNFNLNESIINARAFRQRVLIVEKLLSILEEIHLEKPESVYSIPSAFLIDFLKEYRQNNIEVAIYFSIPSEIIRSLRFESDNRAIERHVKRVLQDRYNKLK